MYAIYNISGTSKEISAELNISVTDIESYFRNYYINKTMPIRDLTQSEVMLVKYYEETRFYSENDIRKYCALNKINFDDYIKDMWIVPKHMISMSDEEYYIAKKYASVILEPFLNYKNATAPRLTPLSKEEITMLLTNIALGKSTLPEEKITAKTSMDAMDRLLALYDSMPKTSDPATNKKIRQLSPKQLERLINNVTKDIEKKSEIELL